MSTEFGKIKSARFDNEVTIYTGMSSDITLFVESGRREFIRKGQGIKIILDQENIDEFLGALSAALKHLGMFSNYLNPDGKIPYKIWKDKTENESGSIQE